MSLYKSKILIGKLKPFTIEIDTWILEHIKFNKNEWYQSVPLGSKLIHCSYNEDEDDDECDIITYFGDPACSDTPSFTIQYLDDHIKCVVGSSRQLDPEHRGYKIQYDDPGMFNKLETWIWNVRAVDHINANFRAIEHNLKQLAMTLESRELASKVGGVQSLLDRTSKLELIIRKLAYSNDNIYRGDVQHPKVDGVDISKGELNCTHEYDSLPLK